MADSKPQEWIGASAKGSDWKGRSIENVDNVEFESTPPGVLDGSTAFQSFRVHEISRHRDRSHVHRKEASIDSQSTPSSGLPSPVPGVRRYGGSLPSSNSSGGSSTKKSKSNTFNIPFIRSGSQQIVIVSESMNDALKHIGGVYPITVILLNEHNNYAPVNDLSQIISNYKFSIWISLRSTENERFNTEVVEIHRKRKELYGSSPFLGTCFDSRLLLIGGLLRKDLPASLKNIRSLDAKSMDRESLDMLGSTITKTHKDRLARIGNYVQEKKTGGTFLFVKLTLTDNRKSKVAAESPIIKEASTSLLDSLTDTTTTIRIYIQKQFKCPHIKVRTDTGVDSSIHYFSCTLELRIHESKAVDVFKSRCKDGTVESIIREHSKVGGRAFGGFVKIELDDQQVADVMQALVQEEKVAEAKKIQRMLESDGSSPSPVAGLVANSETSSNEPPIAQKNAILMDIVENFIKDKTRTPYELLQMLSGKYESLDDWVTLRNVADYNIMHMSVINGRQDFLEMLFYMGLWGVFRQDVARPDGNLGTTNHMGYTARRVAESFSYKERGQEMLQTYDKLDKLWDDASPMIVACLVSDSKLVHALTDIDPKSLNVPDAVGSNCLFYACGQGNTDIVKFLLKNDVDPDKENDQEETCVIIAAKYGHIDVLEALSVFTFQLRGGIDVPSFYNAVDYCALTGNVRGLEFFKKKNLLSNEDRLLTLAAKNKQQTVLNKLLRKDNQQTTEKGEATGKKKESRDELGRTAIHYAALNADRESFKLLADNTVDITERDIHGNTILHLAVESDNLEMVKLVVELLKEKTHLRELINSQNIYTGKDTLYTVRGKDKGRRAWHWLELKRLLLPKFKSSLKTGQVDVIQFGNLLRSGYGPIEDDETKKHMQEFTEQKLRDAQADMTALHVALSKNSTQIALFLLDNGADADAKDSLNATPMHYACMFGNVDILQRLEKMRVDLVPKMNDGKTPVQIAESNDQLAAVNFLEAKVLVLKTQQFVKNLDDTEKRLTEEELNKKRIHGRNVKRHMVDILRDLNIEVNVMLQDLGSGPVLESSN